MEVMVECVCGKRFRVDPERVKDFPCESCGRPLNVPTKALDITLTRLRSRMDQGTPGVREAVKGAVALKNIHALPLIRRAAESGDRESASIAIVGLADYPGPGHELLLKWISESRLTLARVVSAFRDRSYGLGPEFLCGLIDAGRLKESEIAEVADYLGESETEIALATLKAARLQYPNLGSIFKNALSKMHALDADADAIPETAKSIPGKKVDPADAEKGKKKGCFGALILLVAVAAAATAALLQVI